VFELNNTSYGPSGFAIFAVVGIGIFLAIAVVLFLILPIRIPMYTSCQGSACNPNSNITVVDVSIVAGAASNQSSPGYAPDVITVVIGTNNTVRWTNGDSATHTVTDVNGSFDSGDISAGGIYQYNFTTPGIFNYTCTIHPWMHGTVIVKQGTQAVSVVIPSGAANPPSPWNNSHLISNLYYNPNIITVVIGVNNTVTWVNQDSQHHTVTDVNGSFDSGDIAAGATFTYTFDKPGTFVYYCVYHPWMGGEVIVLPGTPGNSTQSTDG
jgi:plastocyanin